MVPGDPSIELMRELVVDRAQRPPYPGLAAHDSCECWAHNAMARHTTFKMMKTLRKVEQAWMTPAAACPPPIAMATTTRGDARIPTVATAMTTSADSQILATATTTAKCGGDPASIAATRESIAAWLPADSPLPSDKTKTPPSPPSGDIPVPAPPSTQLLAPSSGVQVPVTYTDTRVLPSGGEVKPLTPAQLAKIAMMKSSDEDLPVTSRGRCDDPLAITFVPRLASQEREFGVTCDEVAFKVTQRDTNVTSTSTSGVMQHGVATSTSGFAADAGEASEGRETSAAVRKLAELTATPEDEEDAALPRQQQSSDTSVNVC
ncbi:PREDICTED: mucin-7-like [Priapulus caudatus]|uniref:Mucin-7-like n=1 Tax=Priapulus caudatus TaxID=37621 RepID=A0ABM1E5J3_PRICU|nr:PREDICTED: mucin-7-like [Priapulus caudatus]